MKSPKLKNIVVRSGKFWQEDIAVDADVFDDFFMEAATRAIEKRKDEPGLQVTAVLECWEKKYQKNPELHDCINSYFVFINAGLHTKAERLRTNFLKACQIDLQKESMRGDGNEPRTNNTGSTGPK
jgi:hypothetical protein